jgi:hypothetical protein
MIVNLSLVSHTNVGKTTLARTLLRRDIGEIRDRAHVTEIAEGHPLIETADGDALQLWDTPGFGDSARLLKRLQASGNPIGWLLSQVWDRFTDRPFWSSQQAMKNVRESSDAVLYLVNASEDPRSAGYVDAEMQILGWMGKPVVLLLNQVGVPRGADADRADAEAWRRHLAAYPWVRGALGLDAFARCWVQEDALFAKVGEVLDADKRPVMEKLRSAWRARNLGVFGASVAALVDQLAATGADSEPLAPRSLADKARGWVTSVATGKGGADAGPDRALDALARRLDRRVRTATDELIQLHGLSGRAADEILARVAGQVDVETPADAGKAGVIGGVVSGALGGLAADLAAGGLTFGAGALIGGVLGAFGAGGAAKAYNLVRGAGEGKVRWSTQFMDERLVAAVLRYLAVAHFGRGRGDFVQSEYPAHWRAVVESAVGRFDDRLAELWRDAAQGASGTAVAAELTPLVDEVLRDVLVTLYPEAEAIFSGEAIRSDPEGAAEGTPGVPRSTGDAPQGDEPGDSIQATGGARTSYAAQPADRARPGDVADAGPVP